MLGSHPTHLLHLDMSKVCANSFGFSIFILFYFLSLLFFFFLFIFPNFCNIIIPFVNNLFFLLSFPILSHCLLLHLPLSLFVSVSVSSWVCVCLSSTDDMTAYLSLNVARSAVGGILTNPVLKGNTFCFTL